MKKHPVKILMWDIETSYNQTLTFGLIKQFIPIDNITTERHLYSVAYKWYGEKKIHTISILDDPKRFKKDIHDDYYVISEFRKVIEQADAQVAHFGDAFDVKMFNARLCFHGLKPLPKMKSLDTCKLAKKYFRFNSNKLDYLAHHLCGIGKTDNPKNLWIDCFNGDIKAIKWMVKYNKQDVVILEAVFEKLMPFMKDSPLNMNMFLKGARCANPICGSTDIEWRGYNYTKTGKFRRFVCKKCHSWSDERRCVPNNSPEIK